MASFENRGGMHGEARVPAEPLDPHVRSGISRFSVWLGLLGLLWSQHEGIQGRNPAQMLEWGGITAFAVCWAIYVFTAVIVLSGDAIEKRTPLKTDRLRFGEIRGRRETLHRNFDGSYDPVSAGDSARSADACDQVSEVLRV